jgi:predicted transcriptional regulator
MYGMEKTTVYLPPELKRALARAAAARGQSEAQLIREALSAATARQAAPRPRLPLFESGKPGLAEGLEKALAGFGTD